MVQGIAAADFDGDGDIDFAGAGASDGFAHVTFHRGAGLFQGSIAVPVPADSGRFSAGDLDLAGVPGSDLCAFAHRSRQDVADCQ